MPDPCNTCASEETEEGCNLCPYGTGENHWMPREGLIPIGQECNECAFKENEIDTGECKGCKWQEYESQWTPKDS
jgi:hypothetical protein